MTIVPLTPERFDDFVRLIAALESGALDRTAWTTSRIAWLGGSRRWPAFCLAFDLGAAAGLAWILRRGLTAKDVKT